jgi:hypothetical protein
MAMTGKHEDSRPEQEQQPQPSGTDSMPNTPTTGAHGIASGVQRGGTLPGGGPGAGLGSIGTGGASTGGAPTGSVKRGGQ